MEESNSPLISRRSLLHSSLVTAGALAAVGAACGSSGSGAAATSSSTPTLAPVTNGDQALQRLVAGNARFVAGNPINQGRDSVRRAAVAEKQSPFAVILGCADSRVPPEVLFDEGIGDLFLVRVAGNTAE
jgi:carbonic anhydrase